MTGHPIEQLDPSVPGSNRASADASPRIRDMMRTFMGIPLSKSKATSLSLKSLPVSQKSRRSSIISQASTTPSNRDSLKPPNTLHDKPLSKVPKEDRPLANHPLKNVLDSVIKTRLPVVRDRIEKTDQLVYCNSLILRGYLASTTAITAEGATDDAFRSLKCATLDKAELDWLAETERNPMWRDHMQWLPARMVHEFVQESNKYSTEIAEIVTLGPVLGREHFRKLLLSLIEEVDKSRILNVESLQGLVQLVQSSSPGFLNSDDFIKILSLLRTRLRGTHLQSTEHPYHLTLAVSRVLDVMVEHEVKDLDRVIEHEPLCGVLSGLKDSADPYLMYQACYAFQALQYIPDNETPLQAILRHSTGVVDGVVKLSDMFKLDLGALLEGLGKLQEAVGGTTDDATSAYKGVCSLFESGRGVLDSLKEGLGSGQKRPWYPALRAACALAQAGQLKDLKQLIYDAPCRRDPLFQWGICQLLGELADDPLWAIESRQQAVGLLGNLNKNDKDWARDESVHMWMLTIIAKLVANPDYAVSANARELLEGLENTHNDSTQHPYPLRARLPVPASSPVLAKVQHIPFVEYDLFKFRIQRLEEATQPVYIPPMAKANLQAQDDELFILMDKVQEFLDSERQVMVILGDSGAGKSTFNKHLESELLRSYSNGGRIPLFINLPAIDRPDKELISEHLKTHNFSEAQIQELKQHREFIVVCDGYDESQLTANLHTSNSFNRPGQWRVKLIISCRTQYLGQDYRGRFVPQGGSQYNRPALNLFQEAVIAPFSKEQIRDYVEQYVPLEPRTWTTQDYMDKLTTIPNLMDLVKNPLLLTLALEALPDVIEGKKDISAITISRVQLYDIFVDHWINVNKRRLEGNILSAHDRDILEQLLNAGFTFMSIDYSIRLAFAIFERQNGNPVVQYVHIKDEHSWKADFFGPESKVRLLRDSSPLSRAGNLYRFIHRSMLEYFFSRTIFDPCKYGDLEDFTVQPGSESVIVEQLDANSPLFKRSLLTEPSIIQFLCERANQSSSFQKQLLAIVHQSKVDASVATAATNAITILVRAGVRFNGADLRGIRIPGADLSGGQFDSVQLQGANLRGVSFSRSWLRKADFGGAQMEGARFGELPYLQMTDTVYCCTYSPDGKLLAVGLDDGLICLFNTTSWTKVHQYRPLGSPTRGASFPPVLSVSFSSNGRRFIAGDEEGMVRGWNVSSGNICLEIEGHHEAVTSVAFSPCGQQVASAGIDRQVRLWGANFGNSLFVLEGHSESTRSVAYSPSGHRLVSGGDEGVIRCWDPTTGQPDTIQIITGEKIQCLAWSPNGRWIASCFANGGIQLWSAENGESVIAFHGHTGTVTGVAFASSSEWIASSSMDHTVRLWDISGATLPSVFDGHDSAVLDISFSPDGLQMSSCGSDGKVRIWETDSSGSSSDQQFSSGSILNTTYSSDGQSIFSGSNDGTIRQWSSLTGIPGPILLKTAGPFQAVAFSLDGAYIATGAECTIRLWHRQTRATERTLHGHTDKVHTLVFSPCGRWIVSGSDDGTVRLWDLNDSEPGHVIAERPDTRPRLDFCVAFSPTLPQFAIGDFNQSVCLFDAYTISVLKSTSLKDLSITALAFSPSGTQIVLGGSHGEVQLWDLLSEKSRTRLRGHDSHVKSVSISPCGQWVASAYADSTVRLWHLEPAETEPWPCLALVHGSLAPITSIAWNPHVPLEFVTGGEDHSIRVWKVLVDGMSVEVCLHWASTYGQFCALNTKFQDAIGLNALNQGLLTQRATLKPDPKKNLFRSHGPKQGLAGAVAILGLSLISLASKSKY